MNIREDVIYARQSVDRKDSISIESQIDFCKYELKGGSCRVFKDKGYSGKNTDRPEFQKLLGEIRKGKVRRVVVYKLDRISRSILDFANMMELFQEYDVEFVSSTEKFDTSTPMGRAMLNICIVFAQLERETIQKRVTDAYYSRCLKGFHMSGQAPYGFDLEPTVVENIRTKMMVADPIAASHVRLMFEMYAEPETSFGDITRYFEERGIKVYGKSLTRSYLSQLLRNPVYAQADLEMYEFFKSQGTVVVNDAADFAGTNGCYLYQGRDVKEDKDKSLKDQILVIAPHEGFVSADVWLRCRKKLMTNTTFQNGRKARNTWLAGKIKCGKCGYALKTTHNPSGYEYLRCSKRADHKGCPGCGTLRKTEFEQFIFTAMGEKFREFKLLRGGEEKANPKITAYQVELAQVEAEIEKLLDTLTGANATLLAYANKKIEDLDNRRKTLSKAIADLSVETLSSQQIELLSGYLDDWENISFEDKRKAADGLISSISATSNYVKIEWELFLLYQTTCFFIPLVAPCPPLLRDINSEIDEIAALDARIQGLELEVSDINCTLDKYWEKHPLEFDGDKTIVLTTPREALIIRSTSLSLQKAKIIDDLGTEINARDDTLLAELSMAEKEKSDLIRSATKEEQLYQQYLANLESWKEERAKIVGDSKSGLTHYQNELTYLNEQLESDYQNACEQRIDIVKNLFALKEKAVDIYNRIYTPISHQISSLLKELDDGIEFSAEIKLSDENIAERLLAYINQRLSGRFRGKVEAHEQMQDIIKAVDWGTADGVLDFISQVMSSLVDDDFDLLARRISNKEEFYSLLYGLQYIDVSFRLKMGGRNLEELSPGERGIVLLIFYLALSKSNMPIIVDQPEDNLDNQSVYGKLVPCICAAKKRRQVIIVTHNPNIAVACDAEQIVFCQMNKSTSHISYTSGAVENSEVRNEVVDVLEGTMPAFSLRKKKYGNP